MGEKGKKRTIQLKPKINQCKDWKQSLKETYALYSYPLEESKVGCLFGLHFFIADKENKFKDHS